VQWMQSNLRGDDFYREAHRTIFEAMMATFRECNRVDIALLATALRMSGQEEQCGGLEYLKAIARQHFEVTTSAGPSQVRLYGERLRAMTQTRALLRAAGLIERQIEAAPGDAPAAMEVAQREVAAALERNRMVTGLQTAQELGPGVRDHIEAEAARPRGVYGMRTGIRGIDRQLQGLSSQRLILVEGATKFGKTTFCGQTLFASLTCGLPGKALAFVLEGSTEAFLRRFVAWQSGVGSDRLRPGGQEKRMAWEHKLIQDAYVKLQELPLQVTSRVTDIGRIEAEVRNAAMAGPVWGVLVDHAQNVTGGQGENRERKLADVAERLQRLSNEIEAPILLPSQITQKDDGRIMAKGCSALEENCSLSLHVTRGKPGDPRWKRLQSREVVIACELSRDDEPFGEVDCYGQFECYRLWDQAEWEETQSRATQGRQAVWAGQN